MQYYDIKFGYYPGPFSNLIDSDSLSQDASDANVAADRLVQKAARDNSIEMIHAYSWPDGSLYKNIRTNRADLDMEKLISLFTIQAEVESPNPNDTSNKMQKIAMTVSPGIQEMPLTKAQCIKEGAAFFVTLEERFELSAKHANNHKAHQEAMMAIHDVRKAELQAIPEYTAYERARESCAICEPGKLACPDCRKLYDLRWETLREFLAQPRPMNREN